ncbi:hypothetical protein AOLI_G00053100 [Acnodon oligacanthus]
MESESTPTFLESNSPRLNDCSPCACAVSLPARSAVTPQPASLRIRHRDVVALRLRLNLNLDTAEQRREALPGLPSLPLLEGYNSQSAEFTIVEWPLTDRGILFGAAPNLLQIRNPHCSTSLQ